MKLRKENLNIHRRALLNLSHLLKAKGSTVTAVTI